MIFTSQKDITEKPLPPVVSTTTWAHHAERASERPYRARPVGVSEPGRRGSMPEASPHRVTANDQGAERPDPGASAAIGRRDIHTPFTCPHIDNWDQVASPR